jgi:hypothetical protein
MAPLAAAAGTSTRMLVYHFGTRDQLVREVLQRARQRQLEAFGQMLRRRPDEPYLDTLARAWEHITGPEGRPYLRMFNQLHIAQLRDSAGRPLWPDFRRIATTDWLGPSRKAWPACTDPSWQPSCSRPCAGCSWTSTPPATQPAPPAHGTTSWTPSVPDGLNPPRLGSKDLRFPDRSPGQPPRDPDQRE